MSQRSFDFLMTMIQVIGGGVLGGLIAWWAVRAGADAALRHDRELRVEDETNVAVVAYCDAIVAARGKIGDASQALTDESMDPAIRYERARWATRAALDAWAPAQRDYAHSLRTSPLSVHVDNVSNVLVVGGITWFALPYHGHTDVAGLADRLRRFEKYIDDVAMELYRLRRGEPLHGITDAFGVQELSVIAAHVAAEPDADDSDPTDSTIPRQEQAPPG